MPFTLSGLLFKKFDAEKKSETFTVREFVLLTSGQYPQFLKFQLSNDKVSMIDTIPQGSSITVDFDIRGREWEGKYFTTLNAWKVEMDDVKVAEPLDAGSVSDADVEDDELEF